MEAIDAGTFDEQTPPSTEDPLNPVYLAAKIDALQQDVARLHRVALAEQLLSRASLAVLIEQMTLSAGDPSKAARALSDALYRRIDDVVIPGIEGTLFEEIKEVARVGVDVLFSH